MTIEDNGIGFDCDKLSDHNAFGLIGMRERAVLVKGEFYVNSREGKGTAIRISIPLSY